MNYPTTRLLFVGLAVLAAAFIAPEKGLKDYYQNYFPIGVAVNPRMVQPGTDANLIITLKKRFSTPTKPTPRRSCSTTITTPRARPSGNVFIRW